MMGKLDDIGKEIREREVGDGEKVMKAASEVEIQRGSGSVGKRDRGREGGKGRERSGGRERAGERGRELDRAKESESKSELASERASEREKEGWGERGK